MSRTDFSLIEQAIARLLHSLANDLTDQERQEVQSFADVGEYGLAVETLIALLVEERKTINAAIAREIEVLAVAMGMDVNLPDCLFRTDEARPS